MIENLLHQTGMQGMSGSVGNQMSNKGQTQKREVTDKVQDFMAHKFIGKPQTGLIQDPVLRKDDRVLEIAATTESAGPERFHFLQEPEGPCFSDLGRKRMRGMIIRIGLGSDQRMVVLDRIGNSWCGRRLDPDAPGSIDDFQRSGNLQECSTAVLGFYTGRLD